jgi:hypothetical protein
VILAEVERNLVQNADVEAGRAAAMIALMRKHFPGAEVAPPDGLVAAMTNHTKDRHVLAAAVHGECDLLLTDNVKDFPVASCAPHGIVVVTADEFLCGLHDQEPALVLDTVVRLAVILHKPPMTPRNVADALARAHVPDFAGRLHVQLASTDIDELITRT